MHFENVYFDPVHFYLGLAVARCFCYSIFLNRIVISVKLVVFCIARRRRYSVFCMLRAKTDTIKVIEKQ